MRKQRAQIALTFRQQHEAAALSDMGVDLGIPAGGDPQGVRCGLIGDAVTECLNVVADSDFGDQSVPTAGER